MLWTPRLPRRPRRSRSVQQELGQVVERAAPYGEDARRSRDGGEGKAAVSRVGEAEARTRSRHGWLPPRCRRLADTPDARRGRCARVARVTEANLLRVTR